MMSVDPRELKNNISKLSDEELIAIVSVNSINYREEAIYFAAEELTMRGIPFSSAGVTVPPTQLESKYKGVKGWLLLYCLHLMGLSPVYTLSSMGKIIENVPAQLAQLPNPVHRLIAVCQIAFVCLILTGISIFSVYTGIALWTLKHNALKIVNRYLFTRLILLVCFPIILIAANYFLSYSTADTPLTIDIAPIFCTSLSEVLWLAITYSYFSDSKRVRATYNVDASVQ